MKNKFLILLVYYVFGRLLLHVINLTSLKIGNGTIEHMIFEAKYIEFLPFIDYVNQPIFTLKATLIFLVLYFSIYYWLTFKKNINIKPIYYFISYSIINGLLYIIPVLTVMILAGDL